MPAPVVATTSPSAASKVARNQEYAHSLGWDAHLQAIHRTLDRGRVTWDDNAFVRAVHRWQIVTGLPADGILGPVTWSYLRVAAGAARDSAISAQLPATGLGFRAVGDRNRQFGRAETIRALLATAAAWQRAHPRGPRLRIAEIGTIGGGPIDGHRSHRLGLDADIAPIRADGREEPVLWWQPVYSQALTQELVTLLRNNGTLPVHMVFFNDPGLRGVQRQDRHDNHLHVRFRPPSATVRAVTTPVVPAKATTAPSMSSGRGPALGALTVLTPGSPSVRPPYRFTPDDLVWTARLLEGEAGGRDTVENHAVIWTLLNRYALLYRRKSMPFHAMLRTFSTVLQCPLKNYGATKRSLRNEKEFVRTGGVITSQGRPPLPRGQLSRWLALQSRSWERLSPAARSVAVRALSGTLPNPVGNAVDFASTYQYYRDAHAGQEPSDDQWRRYTEDVARRKNLIWIGPVPGLDQKGNTFFLTQRLAHLPVGVVRVLPP